MNQRWRERRDTFRPGRELIDPRRYGVEVLAGLRPALAFPAAADVLVAA